MSEQNIEQLLAGFGDYLLKSRMADERHARFFVIWIRRFLKMTPVIPQATPEESAALFLESLQKTQTADWQIEQARQAIHAWLGWRQNAPATPPKISLHPDGTLDYHDALKVVEQILRVRHYSYRTEQTYLDWIRRFFNYLREIGATIADRPIITTEHFRNFISQLATRGRVAAKTQNQAFAALLFLYREALGLDIGDLSRTVRAREGQRLPTVLSVEEVRRLLAHLEGTPRLMAELIYGGGLRVSECCRLRIQDVDFDNKLLRVRAGKGDKDRTTLLPESVKPALKIHIERVRALFDQDRAAEVAGVHLPDALERKLPKAGVEWPWFWVFPSRGLALDPRANLVRRHHVSEVAVQKPVAEAARQADIPKRVSVHTLRHSFATHLLLQNTDIRQIQELLGHAHVETTMIYTHVLKDLRHAPRSPLDAL